MRMRLLSVGSDGVGYIWEGPILGNIIQISGNAPTAKLKDNVGSLLSSSAAFMDKETNGLLTVSADRMLRLWSLGAVGHLASGGARSSGITAKKRPSLSFSAMTAALSGGMDPGKTTSIECLGRIKTSSSVMKYVSIAPLLHARYVVGTFVVCAKTNTISVVQVRRGSIILCFIFIMFGKLHFFQLEIIMFLSVFKLLGRAWNHLRATRPVSGRPSRDKGAARNLRNCRQCWICH